MSWIEFIEKIFAALVVIHVVEILQESKGWLQSAATPDIVGLLLPQARRWIEDRVPAELTQLSVASFGPTGWEEILDFPPLQSVATEICNLAS